MKKDDPYTIAMYVLGRNLQATSPWKWTTRYSQDAETGESDRTANKASRSGVKTKFGHKVPRKLREALTFDKENGNNKWDHAMKLEVSGLVDIHQVFEILKRGDRAPEGYTKIPLVFCFDVKLDG